LVVGLSLAYLLNKLDCAPR
jgi:hypothetical protein